METRDQALRLLPDPIRRSLRESRLSAPEEIRLRLAKAPTVYTEGKEVQISRLTVSRADLQYVLERASDGSPYTREDSVSQGYLTAAGGIRVGLCGHLRTYDGSWVHSGLTSVNIRLPREIKDCALWLSRQPIISTLILSPPGGGKTTLLRDWIRVLGNRTERVCVCDERSELSGWDGKSFSFDLGEHTDVITGCEKARAAMILLRTMNPSVLAMDEITDAKDIDACLQAAHCGVRVIATAHACDIHELEKRRLYRELLSADVFQKLVLIESVNGKRSYREEML